MVYDKLPKKEVIERVAKALTDNGISAEIVQTREEARKKILQIIPKNAEVMVMTSMTLDDCGISREIGESGYYNPVRKKLMGMDRIKDNREMQKIGAAPEWVIGSVHAVTEEGHVLIASNTGSQLPAYVYGADNVIWVVGAQKIVKNTNKGIKRIYEHSLPLESERAKKAYGVPGSAVNKLLIFNKEIKSGRVRMIIVNEVLGF